MNATTHLKRLAEVRAEARDEQRRTDVADECHWCARGVPRQRLARNDYRHRILDTETGVTLAIYCPASPIHEGEHRVVGYAT